MGVVLVGGASMASATDTPSYDDCYGAPTDEPPERCVTDDGGDYPTPPVSSVPDHAPTPPDHPSTPPDHSSTPPAPHYGPSYPVPNPPPPGTPDNGSSTPPSSPPVLARTGSDSGALVGIGFGALALGAGLVFFARKRRVAMVPA
jgi:LPXTG-motif cell wall-anchored protein